MALVISVSYSVYFVLPCVGRNMTKCITGFLKHLFGDTGGAYIVNCLLGLVVRRPPREQKIPGSNPACVGIFSGSNHTIDLKIGTPVATLPGAWRCRVSTWTGRPGVSIL